ncbi:MAG: hypothetical protein GY869_28515, partial [Planctomycetes bacterium]|nr:hypothetical protein [Planctomycetota bacterium]
DRWPQALDIKVIAEAMEKNPHEEFDILHYIAPSRENGAVKWKTANPAHNYVSLWILSAQNAIINKSAMAGKYEGYHELPMFVPRWIVMPNEIYGVGPGVFALPTIMSLMKTIELKFGAIESVINPGIASEKGNILAVGDDGEWGPGVQMILKNIDKTRPWLTGANIGVAELSEDKLREQLERLWFTRELLLAPDRPEMTAYETAKRVEITHRILGPTSQRIQRELLNPGIERAFGILHRAGKLPPIPNGLQGADLDIEYVS